VSSIRPEEIFVGLVALVLLPVIALRIARGIQQGRLPVYRTYIERDDDRAKFAVMLAIHAATFVLMAIVAADLLFNLDVRDLL
jgi:hypothetical protein